MLQRAANNAYSWWWASHIKTKQSKWMDQNLQEMEQQVKAVLKLLEEGDSFVRGAEIYYKRRPELIHFVEESYRAYRALAERYDQVASFRDRGRRRIRVSQVLEKAIGELEGIFLCNIPSVPNGSVTSGFKKKQHKIISPKGSISVILKSGLSIPQGLDAIHRLQKRILALQTEKEFTRNTYKSGMAKYWELDNEIQEIHKQLCGLEDEFGEGKAIADDEARILMEEGSVMEAQIEHKRVKVSREKLNALKKKFQLLNEVNQEKGASDNDDNQKREEIEYLKENITKQFEVFFSGTLSVTEMAEKIDELLNNMINLKSTVTSQSILAQIEVLEDEKATSIDGKNDVKLKKKIREMEEKLNEIQDLSQTVEDQNNNLQIYFTEANCSIDHISEKVDSMMPLPDDKVDEVEKSSSMEVKSSNEKETKTGIELETTTTGTVMVFTSLQGKDTEAAKEHESDATCTNGGVISHETSMASKKCEDSTARASSLTVNTIAKVGTEGDEPNSKQLLSKGIDDKEKDILMEYNLKLRNQNEDTEKKLKEAEANNQNGMFEIMSQLKELKEKTKLGEASLVIYEKIVVIETQPAQREPSKRRLRCDRCEVQKELSVWMEKGVMLKEELKERFSSLCEIQEEITRALKASAEDDEFKFSSDQAAKFQGEILNMKQENIRVAIEVQAGLNNVTKLQLEFERNHARLSEKWGISRSK
ncbi:hypothetical protein V6Z11_D12G084100 [Gossypium hirsutum]